MKVLLYYKYVNIDNKEEFYNNHRGFCNNLKLKGRIIISTEGLNGTVSGSEDDCIKYIKFVKNDKRFSDIEFKIDDCDEHLFPKLTIKIKPFLIKLSELNIIDPNIETGTHISGKEFNRMMKSEDSIVLDVRSDYEHFIGKFKDSITLDIKKFYHFPEAIQNHPILSNELNKSKNILTYCTGGVRCETASAFLKQIGFKNVFQLDGGIIKYGLEENGKDFDGKCYVFDSRVAIDVNRINPKVITKCYSCEEDCDKMINCMNTKCNRHVTMCYQCYDLFDSCCSVKCKESGNFRKKIILY